MLGVQRWAGGNRAVDEALLDRYDSVPILLDASDVVYSHGSRDAPVARHEGLVRVRRADALDGVDIVLIDIEHGSNIHGMRYILRTCPHVPLQSV